MASTSEPWQTIQEIYPKAREHQICGPKRARKRMRSSASKRSEGQPYRPPSFLIALPRDPGAGLPLAPCHPMAASPQLLMAAAKPGAALPKKTWKKNELFSMFTYGDKDENFVELGCSTQFSAQACVSDPYFLIPAAPISGENHWQRGQELLISLLPICSP